MGIKKANSDIVAVKIGSTDLSAIYHGSDLVWSGYTPYITGKCTTNTNFNLGQLEFVVGSETDEDGLYTFSLVNPHNKRGGKWNNVASAANAAGIKKMWLDGSKIGGEFYGEFVLMNWTTITEFHSTEMMTPQTAGGIWVLFNHTFINASNLEVLDVDFSGIMGYYGYNAYRGLKKISDFSFLRTFETFKVTYAQNHFDACSLLTDTNDLTKYDFTGAINLANFFLNCSSLTDVSLFCDKVAQNNGTIINMASLFSGCSSLTSIDVSNWNTQNVADMSGMFYNNIKLKYLDLSNFNFSKAINLSSFLYNCINLESINRNEFTLNEASIANMFLGCNLKNKLTIKGSIKGCCDGIFQKMNNLTEIDVSELDISNVTSISRFAFNSPNITKITLPTNNDNNCTVFEQSLSALRQPVEIINLKGLVTSKTTSIKWMFDSSTKVQNLDLREWDTTNITTAMGFWDWLGYWNSNNEVRSIQIDGGFFNTNVDTIPMNFGNWTNKEQIASMLTALINHEKTSDDEWEGQTLKIGSITRDTIYNDEDLLALAEQAEGWMLVI